MARRSSRSIFFRTRPTVRQRATKAIAITFIGAAIALGVIYLTLPWTVATAVRFYLKTQGWGTPTLSITQLNLRGVEIRDVSFGDGAVVLKRLAATYTARQLLNREAGTVTVEGLAVTARWGGDGLHVGPLRFPGPERESRPWPKAIPLERMTVTDARLIVALPQRPLTLTITANMAREDDRLQGEASAILNMNVDGQQARLAQANWDGALAPFAPADWPGKAVLDLSAANVELAEGTRLTAEGHMDVTTGGGRITVNAPKPLTIAVGPINRALLANLPEAWQAQLTGGVAASISGSKGAPAFAWYTDSGITFQHADVDVEAKAGTAAVRAALRGKVSGTLGGIPESVAVDDLEVSAANVPLSMGTLTGRLHLEDISGPLMVAEGNLRAEVTLGGTTFAAVKAASVNASIAGRMRLDGQTIALTPQRMSLRAENAAAAAVNFPGSSEATLADRGDEPSSMALVFGAGGTSTLTFDILMGVRGQARLEGSASTVAVDAPRLRIAGYSVPSSGQYDVSAQGRGLLSHELMDLRVTRLDARALPDLITGSGEMQLARLMADRGQTGGPGLGFIYDFKKSSHLYDFTSSIISAKAQALGRMEAHLNQAEQTGTASLSTQPLTFGPNALAAADVFSGASPFASLTGNLEASLQASWGPKSKKGTGRVTARDIAVDLPQGTVTGLAGNLEFASLSPLKLKAPERISAATMEAGLPLREPSFTVHLPGNDTVAISEARAFVLGGQANVAKANIPFGGGEIAPIPLSLNRLSLSAIAQSAKVEGLTATGSVSGTLPIKISAEGLTVEGGKLKSDGDGRIAYKPATPPAALAGSGAIVLQALSNFEYEYISAGVNGDLLSDLKLALNMKGKNPDLYGGYPVSFNLNLGGPLGNILRQGVRGYKLGPEMLSGPPAPSQGNPQAKPGVSDGPAKP